MANIRYQMPVTPDKLTPEQRPNIHCQPRLELYWPVSGPHINRPPEVDCTIKATCPIFLKENCFLTGKKEVDPNGI